MVKYQVDKKGTIDGNGFCYIYKDIKQDRIVKNVNLKVLFLMKNYKANEKSC